MSAREVVAQVRLREYGSEYNADHLSEADFAGEADDILAALADAGWAVVRLPEPAEHATGSRDFGRGFAHAVALARASAEATP